jgi:hypothetical protein
MTMAMTANTTIKTLIRSSNKPSLRTFPVVGPEKRHASAGAATMMETTAIIRSAPGEVGVRGVMQPFGDRAGGVPSCLGDDWISWNAFPILL